MVARATGRTVQALGSPDLLYRRMLAYADLLAALLAVVLTVSVVGDERLRLGSLLGLPLIVAASKISGLYDREELVIRKSTLDEIPQLFQLATIYTLVLWLLEDWLVAGSLGKPQVATLWVAMFAFTFTARYLARGLAARATPPERCLFVGDAGSYARLRSKLEGSNAELVGRMSLQRPARTGQRQVHTEELDHLLGWSGAHRIIIEPQALPDGEMLDFVRAAQSIGVRVSLLPRILEVVGSSVVFDDVAGVTILGVRRFGLSRSSGLIKRSFDIVGGLVAVVALAPLMLLIALAIKRDSGGPVLFRQTRVGRNGERFRICKFRTMCTDAEERKAELRALNECTGGLFKIAADPRVTRVGRLLRRTSLDELPQLFNVLAGNMSLVGPRPLVVDEDEQITGYDRRRLALTPGMTGPWQIQGSARVPLHEMVKLDYLYVAGWSLWTDMKILVRTARFVAARRGM